MPGQAADIEGLLWQYHVPGLAMAVLSPDMEPVCSAHGRRNRTQAVGSTTVFEAASLSKPVFAFIVLQLAGAGKLSLDAPLAAYSPAYIEHDPRAATITARHILSHTAGLPNWRNEEYPLKTYFAPGSRFSYSGEGYVWLQKAVEHVCGDPLERIAIRLVFEPLGMTRSSLVWQDRFEPDHAMPHAVDGTPFADGFTGKRFALYDCAGLCPLPAGRAAPPRPRCVADALRKRAAGPAHLS